MEDSMEKFNNLKATGYFEKELVNDFNEPEWGFPKGRRNPNEKNLKCALREFWEETGIVKSKLIVLNKLFPIQEQFTFCEPLISQEILTKITDKSRISKIPTRVHNNYCGDGFHTNDYDQMYDALQKSGIV
jgi:8-oxo-dGTP pyrophosphatase MutT (NUDIX family)